MVNFRGLRTTKMTDEERQELKNKPHLFVQDPVSGHEIIEELPQETATALMKSKEDLGLYIEQSEWKEYFARARETMPDSQKEITGPISELKPREENISISFIMTHATGLLPCAYMSIERGIIEMR